MFEVMLEIAAHPLGAFRERFEHAYQCVEVDSSPPACWAIFDNSPIPRIHLTEGSHQLRSAVTDPTGEWILPMSWGPIRNIKISVESVVPVDSEEEPDSEEDIEEDPEPPVQMEIPILKVVSPPEMGVITTRMVDMQFEVAIQAQEEFEEHFKQSYVCGRLSHAVNSYCWSIYNTRTVPRWVGLDDGFYTLQASVTHPNTNEIISESWGRVSSFSVLSTVRELRLAGHDEDGEYGSKPPSHIVLDINLRNDKLELIEHKLPIQRGVDLKSVGQKFCRSRGVGNSECVDHIIKEAESRFKILDELENDWRKLMDEKAEKEATQAKKDAELLRRTIQVPEGDDVLIIPDLGDSALEDYLFNAVDTCELEYKQGGVGLECLTIQSELFGMRAKLSDLSKQEELLDFIGNLGAGFGF
jgi:hypothetical protein